jgi:hypothetical protein
MKINKSKLKKKIINDFAKYYLNTSEDNCTYSKENYREAHLKQRIEKLQKNSNFISSKLDMLSKFFANGTEINPSRISPKIQLVLSNSVESEIFRLASFNWSVPVSEGYGRRMRFLVWDESNSKLIGIFALGDAIFNLKARDEYIGWSALDRSKRMVNLMDAYILGAMPGYSNLLCGKLISSLIKSKEVAQAFRNKYKNTIGVISGEHKNPYLAAVTVTSALGRSSIYNRLNLNNQKIFKPIGMTQGWGHFHVSDQLFSELVDYLHSIDDPIFDTYNFGGGANWRIRIIKKALTALGIDSRIMKHGYKREIYICEIASNAIEILNGNKKRCDYSDLKSVDEISALAKKRWVIPRSIRDTSYLTYDKNTHLKSYIYS